MDEVDACHQSQTMSCPPVCLHRTCLHRRCYAPLYQPRTRQYIQKHDNASRHNDKGKEEEEEEAEEKKKMKRGGEWGGWCLLPLRHRH